MRQVLRSVAGGAALCLSALVCPPVAWADEVVTYEVVSDTINVANIEYQTVHGRTLKVAVPLPWREDVPVRAVRILPPDGSQIRADWRPSAVPNNWVTVRVIYQGKVICQSTLDIGNAACYGITPRRG